MPKTPTIGRLRGLLVVVLLLSCAPLRAEWEWDWKAGEVRTVSSIALVLDEIRWMAGDFGGTAMPEPKRMRRAPGKSRFFGEEDELWDVKGILVNSGLLEAKSEWEWWMVILCSISGQSCAMRELRSRMVDRLPTARGLR
ncbi:MAG: hypothetical protein VCA34_02030 [Roseibacillus sp.]